MPINWQDVKRLLVWLGNLDDEIQPALHLLRDSLPNVSIVLLTSSRAIKELLPFVNETLYYTSYWQQETAEKTLIETLQTKQLNAAIIFTNESPYPFAYLCYLAGIPIRIGLSAEFGGGVLSHPVQPPENAQNRYLYLLESANLFIP